MGIRASERGFSLIELGVLVAILAALAAFALPRFASLEVEARAAATQAFEGNLKSGAALAHALWLAQGQPPTVSMESATITLVNGYPNLATIDEVVSDLSSFTYDAATGVFTRVGTTENCTVTYAEARPNARPSFDAELSGC